MAICWTGAFYVGLLDGLLGVAGMIMKLVMKWIIPENSLRLAPVRKKTCKMKNGLP